MNSVDLLRGAVMIIMALDHSRDLWSDAHFDPLDLSRTTPALFLTRWITHFCAPVFVFLAGTSVWLQESRGKSKRELSRFLVTRGLWLIFLELTWVHIVWAFDFHWRLQILQIIWVLGVSMIALAALIHLPLWAVATVGVGMCVFHNLLDGRLPPTWWATILHIQAPLYSGEDHLVFVIYPLIPWIGVMAAGYAFGRLLAKRRAIALLGGAMVVAFLVLRSINGYGDPHRWTSQRSGLYTLLSFIDCAKYPPSLDYLLMTLGPALLLLAVLHRADVGDVHPVVVFGRVPMFYYLLHIPLLSLSVGVIYYMQYGNRLFDVHDPMDIPPGFGFSLPIVYLAWIGAVAILYFPCRAWARLKRERRSSWLSYL
ncbi:MAG: DUF1624 domain-containing protein [Pseudonocardiaceae bacterium]